MRIKHTTIDYLKRERELWNTGQTRIAGIDEVGRGPYAGPVVAAAVILPIDCDIPGAIDSKKMTAADREEAYHIIHEICQSAESNDRRIGIGAASTKEIDSIGLLNATLLAMKRALLKLSPPPDCLLIDGLHIPNNLSIPAEAIVGGDNLSRSIAAASIIAKVTRDRLMTNLDTIYPEYGFASNKGYGTERHRKALEKLGPTRHHRFLFEPVRQAKLNLQCIPDSMTKNPD